MIYRYMLLLLLLRSENLMYGGLMKASSQGIR